MSKKNQKNQPSSTAATPVRMESRAARAATLTADTAEPVAERRPVPVLLITLTLVLLYFADLYILDNGGDVMNKQETGGPFSTQVYDHFTTYAEVVSSHPLDKDKEVLQAGQK